MAQQPEFEETSERYLLGQLSEAEAERFEESYFADDALFERFQAVKDELLDAYARGELAGEKQTRFRKYFLASPAHRRELEETRKFISAVTEISNAAAANGDAPVLIAAGSKSSWLKSFGGFFSLRPFPAGQLAVVVVLLLALAGVWFLISGWRQSPANEEIAVQPTSLRTVTVPADENRNAATSNDNAAAPSPSSANVDKTPDNSDRSPVNVKPSPSPTPKKKAHRPLPNPQPERAKTQSPVNDKKSAPFDLTIATVERDDASTASITLSPVAARSIDKENTVNINSRTRKVRLQLVFKNDDYVSYRATVTTVEGASVWRKNKLPATFKGDGSKNVTLRFPSAVLRGQDYIVILKGQTAGGRTQTIGEYYFRVERGLPSNVTTRDPSEIPGFKRP